MADLSACREKKGILQQSQV